MIVTNDDGIGAPGLDALVRALRAAGRKPAVVAPDRQRSTCGHSMTLGRGLKLEAETPERWKGVSAWKCDGTPTDCVILALDALSLDDSLVLSGVNDGPNLGDDVTYSGTVSAAMEACLAGRPALAVSLVAPHGRRGVHFDTAAALALAVVAQMERDPLPQGVMLNLNVPDLPLSEVKGIYPSHQGNRVYRYRDTIRLETDGQGGRVYHLDGVPCDAPAEGCDLWALARGYAPLTPLQLKLTAWDSLWTMRDRWNLKEMMKP